MQDISSLIFQQFLHIFYSHLISEVAKDLENGNLQAEKAKTGTAEYLVELEQRRSIKVCVKVIILSFMKIEHLIKSLISGRSLVHTLTLVLA